MVVVRMLFVAVIAALPGSTTAYAQTQPLGSPVRLEWTPLRPYLIDAWTSEDGLPQNTVNALTQTRDGYIWLATFGGLVRFDGRNFTTFAAANTPGLATDRILVVYEDRAGALWIGTERDGVFVRRGGVFSRPNWHRRPAESPSLDHPSVSR